ncbi:MAG TPA: ABC transporter permease [Bacillota bacterium]|mgnify:CR=1 FL=1|nr:ABC transporter permease [Bacillota bacterium]HOH10430.1 ABC transporter permease [Bacillota bacterium]HPI01046.1 ABC transporter permease [Bacillota bacterium]HPM63143.1 ABC transporter permease [Bacillota bacterium]HQJ23951.1 ABC transporter permease [Bacillota bacterium]
MNKNPLSLQLDPEMFKPVPKEERVQLVTMRPSTTYWQDASRRLKRNKVAMISIVVILAVFAFAFLGPYIMKATTGFTYEEQIREDVDQPPSLRHWMGTDGLGRDLMVRVMVGTRISLLVGLIATFIILIIGTLYGAIAGLAGGWVDNIMMRFVEILYSVPDILIVILLSVTLKDPLTIMFESGGLLRGLAGVGPGLISIFITFALLYWVGMARMVRGQVLQIKEQEFVTAARALGASNRRIILRHLIPNSIGPIIVTATFQIPSAIFVESFLSFIGLGVSAPMASLGSLASDAMNGVYSYPYRLLFPSLIIALIILAFNQLGDGLRDALDPKMKK